MVLPPSLQVHIWLQGLHDFWVLVVSKSEKTMVLLWVSFIGILCCKLLFDIWKISLKSSGRWIGSSGTLNLGEMSYSWFYSKNVLFLNKIGKGNHLLLDEHTEYKIIPYLWFCFLSKEHPCQSRNNFTENKSLYSSVFPLKLHKLSSDL